MHSFDRIVTHPAVCHGQPCIKGTQIPISLILDILDLGLSETFIFRTYPVLRTEDMREVEEYRQLRKRELLDSVD